jgi:hypothetical protein
MEGSSMRQRIIPLLGLIVLLVSSLQAEILRANYDVSYGIVGKIGVAKAVLDKQGSTYTIDIRLAATGLAKSLSGNRKERHLSRGHIRKGKLISDMYEVTREYRSTKVVKQYLIDHRKKVVRKIYRKYKNGTLVDEQKQRLSFYAPDDLLTLYFNLDMLMPDKTKAGTYVFQAVGAEKQQGKVSVVIPSAKEIPGYEDDLGSGAAWYATVIIHQKIFMSKEGRLQIAVGKDGITQTALLKDLILFGDIKAVRKK